jgi:hypothetical protein
MTGGCLLCEMEQAAPSAVVFRDELWAAEVAPGYEVPDGSSSGCAGTPSG